MMYVFYIKNLLPMQYMQLREHVFNHYLPEIISENEGYFVMDFFKKVDSYNEESCHRGILKIDKEFLFISNECMVFGLDILDSSFKLRRINFSDDFLEFKDFHFASGRLFRTDKTYKFKDEWSSIISNWNLFSISNLDMEILKIKINKIKDRILCEDLLTSKIY